jgi:hypothetical protein
MCCCGVWNARHGKHSLHAASGAGEYAPDKIRSLGTAGAMASGVRCVGGGGEKRSGRDDGPKDGVWGRALQRTRLPATSSTRRNYRLEEGSGNERGGAVSDSLGRHGTDGEGERRWRKVCRLAAESLYWRGKAEKSLLQQSGEWWAREGAHKRAQVPRQRL